MSESRAERGDRIAPSQLVHALGGGRVTPARLTIAEVASGQSHAFTIEQLALGVRKANPRIGLATVYRTVAALVSTGFLDQVGERSGAALYFRCAEGGHHHHLVCTTCGAVSTAPCPARDTVASAESAGYLVTGHDVRIWGVCPACRRTGGD